MFKCTTGATFFQGDNDRIINTVELLLRAHLQFDCKMVVKEEWSLMGSFTV